MASYIFKSFWDTNVTQNVKSLLKKKPNESIRDKILLH